MSPYHLICHPEQASTPPIQISVQLFPAADNGLQIHYLLLGDISVVAISAQQTPTATDGLWEHTCFEAFVAVAGEDGYHEFNFSPSGLWAAYAFTSYRQRKPWHLEQPLCSKCAVSENQLILQVEIPACALPDHIASQALQIGLTAVIETRDAQFSYWAMHHPGAHADFHQRAGFAATIHRFNT